MLSSIYVLEEGMTLRKTAEYTLPPKQALVAYIKQVLFNDYNTWTYPEIVEGMRESDTLADHWYFDKKKGKFGGREAVFAAYPVDTPLPMHSCFTGTRRKSYA